MKPEGAPIALFTATMGGGGAERAMVRLATGLAERGYATDLVLARDDDDASYAAELSERVRVIRLGVRHALVGTSPLARYLRREQPQALLAALNYINVIALVAARLARTGTRVVVVEHNTLSVQNGSSSQWRERLLPALIRRTYPWADAIVAVSDGVADDLARTAALTRERITSINNPVIVPDMTRMAREPCAHPWLRPGHAVPVALAVGRLTRQKGFDTLIRAFAEVRRRRDARLLILGEGPERGRLDTLVADLSLARDVQLAGWVDNVYAYLARADAFVLSSRWEGLPTVLIEALFCGVPVVATDCPSGPREILDNGRLGRLVPVGDATALAAALDDVYDGKVARAAPESWRRFDERVVVDRYLDVLAVT
jgi:glycosyltransferase involved in cell wall biosynthesis